MKKQIKTELKVILAKTPLAIVSVLGIIGGWLPYFKSAVNYSIAQSCFAFLILMAIFVPIAGISDFIDKKIRSKRNKK